jgi:hypothetical protein
LISTRARDTVTNGIWPFSRPDAGHRSVFPGEAAPTPSIRFDHGGTPEADAMLGAAAWPTVLATVLGN